MLTAYYTSPLGRIRLESDGEALIGLYFENGGEPTLSPTDCPIFAQTRLWLDLYFAGEVPDFTPPYRLRGTLFRLRVWEILAKIPYGETVSYGSIAETIAAERGEGRMSAQAVGGAVGHNPVSLIVPCHRVIGKDGILVGYGGGLWRKEALLALERKTSRNSKLYAPHTR